MSKLPGVGNSSDGRDRRPSRSGSLYLITSMADTTWRMFVPTIGLLLVGNAFDEHFSTQPWLMLVGVSVGGVIASVLIKKQLVKGK